MANNTLEVTKRDGTTARLVHIPTRRFLARAPNGETVEVEARARVISKQKVRASNGSVADFQRAGRFDKYRRA